MASPAVLLTVPVETLPCPAGPWLPRPKDHHVLGVQGSLWALCPMEIVLASPVCHSKTLRELARLRGKFYIKYSTPLRGFTTTGTRPGLEEKENGYRIVSKVFIQTQWIGGQE